MMKNPSYTGNDNSKKRKVRDTAFLHADTINILLNTIPVNRQFLDSAPIPICIYKPDKSIFFVNHAFQKITGYSIQELFGLYPPFPYWPRKNPGIKCPKYSEAFSEAVNPVTANFIKKSGEDFWVQIYTKQVNIDNEPGYIISSWIDITELKKSTQELKRLATFNNTLLGHSPHPILILDKEFSVNYVNSAFTALTGYSLDKLKSQKPPFPWWPTDNQDSYTTTLINSTKNRHGKNVYHIVTANGGRIWIQADSTVLKQEHDDMFYLETWTSVTAPEKRQETLSFCISQINNVQERERILISQELHDEYLQTFSIIRMKVGALINKVTSMDKSILSSRISEIETELSVTLRRFRSYAQNLRPHLINEQGLMTAIDNLVNDYNTIDNLRISLTVFGNETKFTNDKELMIFHIIQESVRNIVKHAESTRAGIKIKYFKSHASFSITDNGKGFNIDEIELNITNKKTLGLIGIRERISLISGTLSIESTPGKGTIIKFKVPYH